MSNYYQECIYEIETLIQNQEYKKAKEMLLTELSMPYIPEDAKHKFETLLASLTDEFKDSPLFINDPELIFTLFKKGSDEQKAKALMSLEKINIHQVWDEVETVLMSEIEDDIKRFILLIAFEQNVQKKTQLKLNDKILNVDLSQLVHPFEQSHYLEVMNDLINRFEAKNPSFLGLCIEALNMETLLAFPHWNQRINVDYIEALVYSYLNKGN